MAGLGRTSWSSTPPSEPTARRLIGQLRACEASALAFCRLLERWRRGEAQPATAGGREAALQHAADRVETALAGLEAPLGRYLLELEADRAEGRSWYSGPGAGELVEWRPVLDARGRQRLAGPRRVRYLELAVLVRALQGLRTRPGSMRSGPRPRSGRACSTCATRCSARRSTTSERWPPSNRLLLGFSPLDHGRRLGQPRSGRARRADAEAGGDRHRRELERVTGRQGRQSGRRLRTARAQVRSSARWATMRSPRRLCRARAGSSSLRPRVAGPTGVALIFVDAAGENQIVVAPGANGQLGAVDLPPSDAVLCQLEIPDEAVINAWERASFFCLNAAPARPIDVDADLTVVNRHELEVLRRRDGLIALTLGAEGPCCSRTGRRSLVRRRRPCRPSTEPPPAMPSRRACSSRCSRAATARRRSAARARPARSPPPASGRNRHCRPRPRWTRYSRA